MGSALRMCVHVHTIFNKITIYLFHTSSNGYDKLNYPSIVCIQHHDNFINIYADNHCLSPLILSNANMEI